MTDTIHTALRACFVDAPDSKSAQRRITIAVNTSRTMSRSKAMMLRALRDALYADCMEQAESAARALVEHFAD